MKRTAFFTLFSLFTAIWCFSQADLQPAAIVNLTKSEPITVKQFRTEVESMEKASGRALNQNEQREVLDAMINERLAIQAAERERVAVADSEVNRQIDQLKNQMAQNIGRQPTDAEFATAIRSQTGLEMPAFREKLRRQLVIQKYLMAKKQSTIENVKVPSEADIVSQYNLAKAQLVRPDTVRISMIQAAYGQDAASKTRAKELIDRLAREIGTNPSKFDEVFIRGRAPNSGYYAGDEGYLPRSMQTAQIVGQEFITIAFSLKQGEVSKVIEGQRGYQIIKVTETYAQKNLDLDDIVQPGSRVTVREYIGNSMLQERQAEAIAKASQELIDDLRKGKPFQIFERNLSWQ
jgi:parvulin-like peptidyl-prolyl isomerase